MNRIGFSTGALARGDFRRGLNLQRRGDIKAVELSALREHELPGLLDSLDSLDLSDFDYISFHAPSRLEELNPAELVERLQRVAERGWPIIVHPDVLGDRVEAWRVLGDKLLLENMDIRKPICRTTAEMRPLFAQLPDARFCFDIGHARQIDPTMSVAVEMLLELGDKVAQVHISEVNWECKHRRISSVAAMAFQSVARWIPREAPVIIESVISESDIDHELGVVRQCLDPGAPIFRHRVPRKDPIVA
jgi:hypothetical protein